MLAPFLFKIMTKEEKQEKGIALALIAYLLLEQAGSVLKEDGKYYKGKTKMLLNNLLQDSNGIFLNIKNLRRLILSKETIQKVEKQLNQEIEQEVMEEELDTSKRIFVNLASLYIMKGVDKMYDLERITSNLLENKRVFTQDEVVDVLKKYNKQINPVLKLEDEYLINNFVK